MIEVIVNAGICGYVSTVRAEADPMGIVSVEIDTKCSYVKGMEKDLVDIDGVAEIFEKFDTSIVYGSASKNCKHLACPVPCGIIKGIEAACGLALPKDAEIKVHKK